MKSLITYFGGKGTMFNNIKKEFPTEFDIYLEPFSGSYSIGFQATEILKTKVEIYNDLELNVYSLFKVLSDKTLFEDFKTKLDLTPYCEKIREEYKNLLKKDLSILDRAYYFFYVNRTSFNGNGGFSIQPVNRRGMSKNVSSYLTAIEGLFEYHDRISKVVICNKDANDLIEKYNQSNCFLYCDPPYVWDTRTSTRYKQDMDNNQHLIFIENVLKSNAKILISGYDHSYYDKLVDNGWQKIQFNVNTTSGNFNPKTKTETLWKNY